MDTIYEGKEVRIGFSPQAQNTFGTRKVDGDVFTEVSAEVVEMTRDIKTHELTTSSGTKQPVYADRISNTTGSVPSFVVTGPFSYYEGDQFMNAFFQAVKERDAAPFRKEFTPFSIHPDFTAADEGHYLTWIKRFPKASASWAAEGCVAKSFKLECERDGFLISECEWFAHGALELDANPSGTWERGLTAVGGGDGQPTSYGILFFNDLDTVQVTIMTAAAVTPTLKKFSIEVNREVEGVGPDGSGSFNNWGMSQVAGTMEITMLKDDLTDSLLHSHETDDFIQLNVNWGAANATAVGEVEIIATGKITDIVIGEDGLTESVITADLLAADSSSDMLNIKVANNIDRTWTGTA